MSPQSRMRSALTELSPQEMKKCCRLRPWAEVSDSISKNLCYTILSYTILYYIILYYTILYYTILYYTILYYTTLYYTINYIILRLRLYEVMPGYILLCDHCSCRACGL